MNGIKSKYYELDKIRSYRLIVIDRAVKEFKRKLGIKSLPIDCVQLVLKINDDTGLNIRFKSTSVLPKGVLGRTQYIREIDLYLVVINQSQLYDSIRHRAKYPFIYSSDRMVNFTIAHELGHIFLNHAAIPDTYKTDEIKAEEDLEANEFAGRLLMPKASIENCNFSSIAAVAAEYLVSEQAVYKRLTHLGRLDKRNMYPTSVCPNCWNPNISYVDHFCSICGIPLTNKKGVFTMHYTDGYKIDQNGRAIPCPRCGNSHYEDDDKFCRICGIFLHNSCTNTYCEVDTIMDGSSRYCSNCGNQTTFLSSGILNDWKPAKEAILNIQEFEEDLFGPGCKPQIIEEWDYFIELVSDHYSTYLSGLLGESQAKHYDNILLILLKDTDIKDRLDHKGYPEQIRAATREYLDLYFDEVHIIAYEDYVPQSEPMASDQIPF